MNGENAFQDALSWLEKNKASCTDDEGGQATLLRLCRRVLDLCRTTYRFYSMPFTSHRLSQNPEGKVRTKCKKEIIQIMAEHGHLEMFDEMSKVLHREVPLACFRYLGRALASNDLDQMKKRYAELVTSFPAWDVC